MSIDRKALATALAKATAYKQCGQDGKANYWAREIVNLLQCHDILKGY